MAVWEKFGVRARQDAIMLQPDSGRDFHDNGRDASAGRSSLLSSVTHLALHCCLAIPLGWAFSPP